LLRFARLPMLNQLLRQFSRQWNGRSIKRMVPDSLATGALGEP
jgi:hypothetical protein